MNNTMGATQQSIPVSPADAAMDMPHRTMPGSDCLGAFNIQLIGWSGEAAAVSPPVGGWPSEKAFLASTNVAPKGKLDR